jgi:hypothetical protein
MFSTASQKVRPQKSVSPWMGEWPTLNEWIIKVFIGAKFHIDSLLGKTRLYNSKKLQLYLD